MVKLPPHVLALARRQDGVVSRRQLMGAGVLDAEIRSWLRHRCLATVQSGVYLTHTGDPRPEQQRWAALLYAAPAVLWGPDALPAVRAVRRPPSGEVHVAIDERRRVRKTDGIVVHRVVDLGSKALLHLSPPRIRPEEAALDVAATARDDLGAVAVLAEVVSGGHTTAARLSAALGARSRIARRPFLAELLDDIAGGACSVLERTYVRDVERAHGLPAADRQVRASARGTIFRDVLYARYGVVVELDGRLDHTDVVARARDLDRDLEAAADDLVTLRLGWGQSVRPCATATAVGRVLRRRGWAGRLRRCHRCR